MEALSLPRGLLTLAEWEALPEGSGLRLELTEGIVGVSPHPDERHQNAVTELTRRTNDQLPDDVTAVAGVEVVLSGEPPTIRVPDVMVTSTAAHQRRPVRHVAADVRLVVEVLGDGTRKLDRVLKRSEYADAEIPQYWIVEPEAPATLTAYLLVGGGYELVAETTGPVDLEVAGHPVRVDPAALTRR